MSSECLRILNFYLTILRCLEYPGNLGISSICEMKMLAKEITDVNRAMVCLFFMGYKEKRARMHFYPFRGVLEGRHYHGLFLPKPIESIRC
jgi:hypothetical protein